MSGNNPVTPQRREIEIMRILFERRLKDRAIALADSRFPGAGKMVDLAYEWGQLNPNERRDRLSDIGPEEIARLREFAALNPDLARAVDELDRRGVLPHIEAAAIDVAAAARETRPAADGAGAGAATSAAAAAAKPAQAAPENSSPEPVVTPPEAEAIEFDFEAAQISPLSVDMPELDLGLQSTDEFLEEQLSRRNEVSKATEEAMERVRRNLDQATQRAFQRSSSIGMPKMPEVVRPTLPSVALQPKEDVVAQTREPVNAIDAPRALARHLDKRVVAIIRPDDPAPTADQLVALANDRQIGFTEHRLVLGNRKEVFGSLVSEFGRIRVQAGSIPKAIAGPNLLVIRGKLSPQLAERIEQGFFDIPGTRASVEVHPDARVIVMRD